MTGKYRALTALTTLLLLSAEASATIVRFETAQGRFDVNLYDKKTPATVANFLAYVNSGAYNTVVFHRSVSGFIVQGGGYTFPGALPLGTVSARAAVVNEPLLSNVRGTIAMAKVAGNPNSATSQWFINVANNSSTLDTQNSGFTVFGEVVSGGMTVVDAINALPTFNVATGFEELPLRNYTTANLTAGVAITDQNLVYATTVSVLDSNVDSAASLTPVTNTLIKGSSSTSTSGSTSSSGGGGGATGVLSVLGLGALALGRRLRRR